jgi:hypothetical protein
VGAGNRQKYRSGLSVSVTTDPRGDRYRCLTACCPLGGLDAR